MSCKIIVFRFFFFLLLQNKSLNSWFVFWKTKCMKDNIVFVLLRFVGKIPIYNVELDIFIPKRHHEIIK